MLVFAYDGSLNGDWIAHYALRFARATLTRRLHLVHVFDQTPSNETEGRIARIVEESAQQGVSLSTEMRRSSRGSASAAVLAALPDAHDTILVTGTRAQPRNLCYLADTVAAQLLAQAPCAVLALHVVHPAWLGQPGHVLLPFTTDHAAPHAALPLLHLLAPDLRELQVLMVHELSSLRFRLLGSRAAQRMIAAAQLRADAIETLLRDALTEHPCVVDASAVVSDDAAKETLVLAARLRSRLIGLDAGQLPAHPTYAHPLEQILRDSSSDVVLYRAAP